MNASAETNCKCSMRGVALALVVVILCSSALADRTVEIPFTLVRGWTVIRATVNGSPGAFIVDTGAMNTEVSLRLVNTVGEHPTATVQKGGGRIEGIRVRAVVKAGDGEALNLPVFVYDCLEISEAAGKQLDGVLGMDYLGLYDTVEIDFRAKIIRLSSR